MKPAAILSNCRVTRFLILKSKLILEKETHYMWVFANTQWIQHKDKTQIVLLSLHSMEVVWESRQLP